VDLRPEIAGVIASFEFAEGDRVKRGDVLFRLRSERQRAARARGRRVSGVRSSWRGSRSRPWPSSTARAELDAADASVEIAKAELDRTEIRARLNLLAGAALDLTLAQVEAVADEVLPEGEGYGITWACESEQFFECNAAVRVPVRRRADLPSARGAGAARQRRVAARPPTVRSRRR
jgi:multidrug efflux pump subunit AcrA (membrane-fusion protein)